MTSDVDTGARGSTRGDERSVLESPVRKRREWAAILGLVAVSSVVVFWRLASAFTFMMDDLIQFDLANRAGLSWEVLLQNVFQHFGPVNRLGHLVLLRWGEVDPRRGALLAAAVVAVLLVVVAWLATELGLGLIRRLLLVVLVGGSLSVLDSAVWTDALLHVLLALIATYTITACHLRAVRLGSSGWHAASVLMFAAGLLVQERTAFALPLIVLVDMLLVWRTQSWRSRFRRLRVQRWPLLAMASIGLLAAALIDRYYASTGDGHFSPGPGLRTWLLALTNFQFPQLAGYQPAGDLRPAEQLAVLAVIVVGAGGLIAMNRAANTGPVQFFFAVFTLYWAFLVLSPMLDDATVGWNAARLHNAAYVTVPAYLAILSLSGPRSWVRRWQARPARTRHRIGVMVVATTLVLISVAGAIHANRTWERYRSAHTFWTGVRDSESVWADPAVTVVPLQAPPSVAGDWAVIYGQERFLLPIFVPTWAPGPVSGRTVALTPEGEPIDVVLDPVASAEPAGTGSGPTCLTPTSPDDRFAFVARGSVPAGSPILAHVRYTATQDGQMSALPLSGGNTHPPVRPVPLTQPGGDVLIPLPIDQPDSMVLGDLRVGATTCIESIVMVRPLALDEDGRCRDLDPFGTVGVFTRCPDAA